MKVRLVSYSKASEFETYEDGPLLGIQDLIAYCAKVSNPNHQINTETHERLLNYLIKHKHWSPFEMASACLEIDTTRDIAHQIVRHRSFSFQEFSQRYANVGEMGDMFDFAEARLQDTKNRIVTEISNSWSNYQSLKSVLEATKAQLRAAEIANEGITLEYDSGNSRSTLEVIQSRSLLLDARIAFAKSERDFMVSQFELAKQIGTLSLELLK